jgi:hypothetical protein
VIAQVIFSTMCTALLRHPGYIVPSNADIPELNVLFVCEFDEEAKPFRRQGLGELTVVSVAPALANAVYHATGERIRDLPITVENCCEVERATSHALRKIDLGLRPRSQQVKR